jgi:membrane peptidoglycan carboxypeptidase
MPKNDPQLDDALVAIRPGTGEILAYYGGKGDYGQADMADRRNPHPPGSSMKPYTLATAIDQGISIKSMWDPKSPRPFPDRKNPLKNASKARCNPCTLIETTAESLNTIYWALADKVGPKKVRETARKAGISVLGTKLVNGEFVKIKIEDRGVDGSIGIGQDPIPVVEHAGGYATFANNGIYVRPHLVARIVDSKGQDLFKFKKNAESHRAFSEDAAKDAGFAMQQVVKKTTAAHLADDRPAAGKTGTQDLNGNGGNINSDVWMGGYTPQVAAAVWLGHRDGTRAIKFAPGGPNARNIGSVYTAEIWKNFMDAALAGLPADRLPDPVFAGDVNQGEVLTQLTPPDEQGNQGDGNQERGGLPPLIPTQGPQQPSPTPGNPDNPGDPGPSTGPSPKPSSRFPPPPPPPGFANPNGRSRFGG